MATISFKELAIDSDLRLSKKQQFNTSALKTWRVRWPATNPIDNVLIAVLADSISHEREASAMGDFVVKRIRSAMVNPDLAMLSVQERVKRGLEQANREIFARAARENRRGKLGVSVIVALLMLVDDKMTLHLLHVGNCGAYLIRGGHPYALTTPHVREQAPRTSPGGYQDGTAAWSRPIHYVGFDVSLTLDETIRLPDGANPAAVAKALLLAPGDRIVLCSVQVQPTVIDHLALIVQRSYSKAAAKALVKRAAATPIAPVISGDGAGTDVVALVIARRPFAPPWWRGCLPFLLAVGLFFASTFFWGGYSPGSWPPPVETLIVFCCATASPTITPTFTPVPATATAIPLPPSPTVTAISNPTLITPATLIPTPVRITRAIPTATPVLATPYELPTVTPTPIPPTRTPTPVATPTAISTATPTDEQAPTLVATPTITETSTPEMTATATELAPLAPLPAGFAITLGEPEANFTAIGRTEFTWSASTTLPEGYDFELIFWRRGEDPIRNGRGYGGKSRNSFATVNFEKLGLRSEETGEYLWGVRLLRVGSDQPLDYYWGERRIVIHFKPEPTTSCAVAGDSGCKPE